MDLQDAENRLRETKEEIQGALLLWPGRPGREEARQLENFANEIRELLDFISEWAGIFLRQKE